MSTYVDICIAISYCFPEEPRHQEAVEIVNEVGRDRPFYISPFSAVELYCTLAKHVSKYKLLPVLQEMPEAMKVEGMVNLVIGKLNLKIYPPDEPRVKDMIGTKIFHKFWEAIQRAPDIKLPTGDMLNLVYALQLKEKGKVKQIISLDENFTNNRDLIERLTGLVVKC